jgi:hypothetical protein
MRDPFAEYALDLRSPGQQRLDLFGGRVSIRGRRDLLVEFFK